MFSGKDESETILDIDTPPTNNGRYSAVNRTKSEGSHYTPKNLADFIANQIANRDWPEGRTLKILDPAIGDGELVIALLEALKLCGVERVEVYGFETSATALRLAESRIATLFPAVCVHMSCGSFLDFVLRTYRHDLFGATIDEPIQFDVVIANPPYVRTQVMGATQARHLAKQFNLRGRVDLYHAFLLAIEEALAPGGLMGIIVSNRFMTTRSGAAVRQDILKRFHVQHVWDLGDTRIFSAAVLPAVMLLQKKGPRAETAPSRFTSVYSSKSSGDALSCVDVVDGLALSGLIENAGGQRYFVEHGYLDHGEEEAGVWSIKTDRSDDWLAKVSAHTWGKFGDIGKIRVGVKTTADKVFIRSDWDKIPPEARPELLRPIITHHIARRFRSLDAGPKLKILYAHAVVNGKRCAVSLAQFPHTAQYLEQNRAALEARTYVTGSGRNWYEIWVPQDPGAWAAPKLVFREISERPTFWIDLQGDIVNGDCFWITCSDPARERLLWLALAVANSTFVEAYYDQCFCNKLYAGRRRFCTQYVENFPLPDPDNAVSQQMISIAEQLYSDPSSPGAGQLEADLSLLTWRAFGVSGKEGVGYQI